MAYYKKRKAPAFIHLTEADRERLARVEHDPRNDWQKLKHKVVLKSKNVAQEVVFYMYGKDEDDLRDNIAKQLSFFKAADERWEISEDVDMRALARDARLEAIAAAASQEDA